MIRENKYFLALLLFCFQTGCISNPALDKSNESVWIYSYKGHIDTRTSACNECLARWTISGNLSLYHNENSFIVKLDDLKTSVFNGNKSNLQHAQEKEIPKEAKVLLEPFIIKPDYKTLSVIVKPNEPLWSINMKKAIANFILDTDTDKKPKNSKTVEFTVPEKTLYGNNCEVSYTMKSAPFIDGYEYHKKMDKLNCLEKSIFHETNTFRAPGITDLSDVLDFKTEKSGLIQITKDVHYPHKIKSKSHIVYKTMPSAPYTLHIDQEQSIHFMEMRDVDEPINISEKTEKIDIIYEIGDEPTSGRHTYEKDVYVLKRQFLKNYDKFEDNFLHSPSENYDIRNGDPVEKMYMILKSIDSPGLEQIAHSIINKPGQDSNDMAYFYFSLLSHIGTNNTVEYINNIIQKATSKSYDAILMRVLTTFSQNIQYPSDEMLLSLEPLMNIGDVEQRSFKTAGVLSFASAVAKACRKNMISRKFLTKYTDLFHNKILEGENYEEQMTYLLGFVNMAECLDLNIINGITMNTSVSSNIRVLALTGFKNHLHKKSNKIFEIYWPMVQRTSEPFEVRVAALDLLLSANLSETQFNSILMKYSSHLNEPEDKQLANYLLTSLHSLKNSTRYFDNLGSLATEAIKNTNIPAYPKAFASGNYRLAYTDADSNIGALFETCIITDPHTNIPNVLKFTFNNFAMSFDFGTYSFYLKFDGVFESEQAKAFLYDYYKNGGISSLPELLKLLKDNKFEVKMPNERVHIDLVFFVNDVAVYAKHLDRFEPKDISKLTNELKDIITTSIYISYPVMDYIHIPSELGTPIQITNCMQDIKRHLFDKADNNYKYRSLWSFNTWLEAYNPLADVNIATYKYYNNENNLNINFNKNNESVNSYTWVNEDDTYTQYWDNMMGTTVEEKEILEKYCPQCEEFNEISTDIDNSYTKDWEPLGFNILVETHTHNFPDPVYLDSMFRELYTPTIIPLYNIDAFPYAGPILYKAHLLNRKFWLKSELERGSFRTSSISGYNETTETFLSYYLSGISKNDFKLSNEMHFSVQIETKDPTNNETRTYGNFTYVVSSNLGNSAVDGTTNLTLWQNFNLKFISAKVNSLATPHMNNSIKLCATRELNFGKIRSDKLSLQPSEVATGKTVFTWAKNIADNEDCVPHVIFTLIETFSTTDKAKIIEDKNMLQDYEKCLSDSKNLKFTSPTAVCKRISSRLTDYDNYKANFKIVKYIVKNEPEEGEGFLFQYSRVDKDKINLLSVVYLENNAGKWYVNHTFYYPHKLIDPSSWTYNDDEIAVPGFASSTCTITPSTIEQFSGKYIPNQNKEWLAFGECYNISRRGLIGHTNDEKNIGFTYYSNENVVTATVKGGKLEVKINGEKRREFAAPHTVFKVYSLDENVLYIKDADKVDIYYNTEYISVKADNTYPKLLCGLCIQGNK